MKIKSLILLISLCFVGTVLNAAASKDESIDKSPFPEYFRKITPEFLYSYIDFNFNSATETNFNRYNGHANLYSAGADHLSLGSTMMAGIYYFGIDTEISSEFLLIPGSITSSQQTIHNHTLFGHLFKIITPSFFVDLGAGYGFNKLINFNQIATDAAPLMAESSNNYNNWFVSANSIYMKIWNQILLRANLGVLYSQIDMGRYNLVFPSTNTTQTVAPLTNQATLVLESVELGYFIKPTLMPFINGSLIQVAQFSNSRSLVIPETFVNGTLPQLSMDRSGFRVGGGVAFTYKNISLRIEEKYYNAGGTFQSYQTLAALEYQFS